MANSRTQQPDDTICNQHIINTFVAFLSNNTSLEIIKKVTQANVAIQNQDMPFSIREQAATIAAQHDRLDVLIWLITEMGCPLDAEKLKNYPIQIAIKNNRLPMVIWLIQNLNAENEIEFQCFKAAIKKGHLSVLAYLFDEEIDQDCDEDDSIFLAAIIYKQYDILLWMLCNQTNCVTEELKGSSKTDIISTLNDYIDTLPIKKSKELAKHLNPILQTLHMHSEINTIESKLCSNKSTDSPHKKRRLDGFFKTPPKISISRKVVSSPFIDSGICPRK